jgi:hypothetical protein
MGIPVGRPGGVKIPIVLIWFKVRVDQFISLECMRMGPRSGKGLETRSPAFATFTSYALA